MCDSGGWGEKEGGRGEEEWNGKRGGRERERRKEWNGKGEGGREGGRGEFFCCLGLLGWW